MPKRWQQLAQVADDLDYVQVLLHDDPDPDAVAGGLALGYLLQTALNIETSTGYRGVIGRAENKALVRYMQSSLHELPDNFVPEGPVALIDTQPGAGNSPVKADFPEIIAVIDHHGDLGGEQARFRDIRPWIGASATIVTQYFRSANVKPPARIATGLFYGIKTDTKSLSRDTSAADVAAYFYLLPFVDVDAIVNIENAQVPPAYFRNLAKAMQAASVYEGVVISYLGQTGYPDLTAEIADLLLRLEGIQWVVCMGVYEQELYVSVRARSEDADAEKLAQTIIGELGSAGGRNTLAGGQVHLDGKDPAEVSETIRQRALEQLNIPPDAAGEALVP